MKLNSLMRRFTPATMKSPLLDPGIIQAAQEITKHTPDFWRLQAKVGWFVFVADEMMRGRRCESMLPSSEAIRMATAYTRRKFIMLNKQLGKASWPALLSPNPAMSGPIGRAKGALVKGELYFVRPKHILELDKYKENGKIHTRQMVQLDIPYRERLTRDVISIITQGKTKVEKASFEDILSEWKHCTDISAFTYVGEDEHFFWNNYSEASFVSAKLTVPSDRNLKPYYFFE